MEHTFTVVDRFVRYAKIDTQSDPHSETTPSTEKQKDLSRLLVQELLDLGVSDAEMDEHGYVYATLKSNSPKKVPTICFCSHVDTSPESSGANVNPTFHKNYDGSVISLPMNAEVKIDPAEHPELATKVGMDIITSDGTTLLGADNKAGVAEIMDMVAYFQANPDQPHGDVRILFTPDEEIGRGADKVDIEKLGAKYGYTVDGEALGSFEDETFSADMVKVIIRGVNTHPGFAKDQMESALKAASAFIDLLPKDGWSPETTDKREGFVHPYEMNGGVESMELIFIIRSFVDADLAVYEAELEGLLQTAMEAFPNSTYSFAASAQYRNMKNVIDGCPEVSQFAKEAIERTGLTVRAGSIRGGTDGSKLSFMGLPCPNIFAGEHAFHSKMEWACVQDMEKAVETLVNLVQIWEERS
ncbi:peptidase T [Salibacteraceae bacterium]|jgi:tripeptide aminopeptidase|nr:peptidase T [Flavobacteriales bacterium]MDB9701271.1 peptidase T [Salibacteraceae bacterium]